MLSISLSQENKYGLLFSRSVLHWEHTWHVNTLLRNQSTDLCECESSISTQDLKSPLKSPSCLPCVLFKRGPSQLFCSVKMLHVRNIAVLCVVFCAWTSARGHNISSRCAQDAGMFLTELKKSPPENYAVQSKSWTGIYNLLQFYYNYNLL